GVLKGAFVLMADLSRHVNLPMEFDFMAVSSYGAATQTSGVVRILKDLDHEILGRDVLLVEDIVDSGLTLSYLLKNLRTRPPASACSSAGSGRGWLGGRALVGRRGEGRSIRAAGAERWRGQPAPAGSWRAPGPARRWRPRWW